MPRISRRDGKAAWDEDGALLFANGTAERK